MSTYSLGRCPSCKREIVRRAEPTRAGELRRASWDCKCDVGGIHGESVEFDPSYVRPSGFVKVVPYR